MSNYKLQVIIRTNDKGTLQGQFVEIPLAENVYNALYEQLQGDTEYSQSRIKSSRLGVNQCADAYLVNGGNITAGIRGMSETEERQYKVTFKK